MKRHKGIGVLDSGLGGLSVASEIRRLLPNEQIIYFGDTAHLPYGDKTETQIVKYVTDIVTFLGKEGIKALIMACNTSSAVVLPRLKGKLNIPALGVIEFAVKSALENTKTMKIGVVANPVTVNSGAYVKNLKTMANQNVDVIQQACPRWVPLVENGELQGEKVEEILRQDLKCFENGKIDTLILGCTHYPFLSPVIKKILGQNVKIIDPACSLTEHLKTLLNTGDLNNDQPFPNHLFFVSGDNEEFRKKGADFFGEKIPQVTTVKLSKEVLVKI